MSSEGNTGPRTRARAFCFTSFKTEEPVFKPCMKYLAYGHETCPTTQRSHWQGFVYFNEAKTVSAAAKNLDKAHCEIMRGSFEDNERYCSKEGSYTKHGVLPDQGARTDLRNLRDLVLSGTSVESIMMEDPMVYHQYGRTLEKIETVALRKNYRTEMTTCTWYHGATGTGKSHAALAQYHPETHYLVNLADNGWWEGYKQQETVVIQEYRGNGISYEQLLQLVDKWPYNVNRRCREPIPFTSKHIIVTSPMHPEEVFQGLLRGNDSIKQLLRRVKVVALSEAYNQ